ncbi:hypothetical protein PCASD_00162 [Puccinia coronata f. sp. avenae]|uniref:F-box domain-containing protein n=1 Tax=Puccinia coronata f. sp. avenae TaxID=200324 RepID=A0A2N5TFT0_9BASI|nr:hypothetical protein PCASD_09276 [Puccinia coronata f. sp. avenae]PLW52205.1 hypothetical protein PCASD_00162 [Puccinia coronata f. sp. avenae]
MSPPEKPTIPQLPFELKQLIHDMLRDSWTTLSDYSVRPRPSPGFPSQRNVGCAQQQLNLDHEGLPRLSVLNHEIMPRHSERVTHIRIGLDIQSLTVKPKPLNSRIHQIHQERRYSQVCDIIQACTNLRHMALEIDPQPYSTDDEGDFLFEPAFPASKMLKPISQLSHLTAFDLRPPWTDKFFSEEFVVRLIRDMIHLVDFECAWVKPTSNRQPSEYSNSDQVSVSPLAVHLSSLSSLKLLALDCVQCFDLSWSQIKWRPTLLNLSISFCNKANVQNLHSFCMLFKESLETLSISDLPSSSKEKNTFSNNLPLPDLQYTFSLPELIRLEVYYDAPLQFLILFREAWSLKSLFFQINPAISKVDLKQLIDENEPLWANLKSLIIEQNCDILTDEEIEDLSAYGSKTGVKVLVDYIEESLASQNDSELAAQMDAHELIE